MAQKWKTKLAYPLYTRDGKQLKTLDDARRYAVDLPDGIGERNDGTDAARAVPEHAVGRGEDVMTLTLVHRSRTDPQSSWNDDQFSVVCDGKTVGSIVKQSMSGTSERWWWEISIPGPDPNPMERKGPAQTRDDAMAAFREAWDRLNKERQAQGQ
jgi:hypothetical protein